MLFSLSWIVNSKSDKNYKVRALLWIVISKSDNNYKLRNLLNSTGDR